MTGDVNKDGKGDILWRLADGAVMASLGNGLSAPTSKMFGGVGPTAATWRFAGAPDLDADGDDDVLWRNSLFNNVNGWRMQGLVRQQGSPIKPVQDGRAILR